MPHAASNGLRIHWEAQGEGDPLLLIMGFGLGREAWAPLVPFLDGYRVILVDNRGTGLSDPPPPGTRIADMAADCVAVLDAAAVERAHVFGVSMGGMITQSMALDHAARVGAIVLGCTTPGPLRILGDPEAAMRLFQGVALGATDPEAALDILLPLLFSDGFLAANPAIRDLARETMARAGASESAETVMKAMVDLETGEAFDVYDRIPGLAVPTLVQHGSADRIIPVEAGRWLGAAIPGATYQELDGAGHAYPQEQPLAVFERIRAHLAAHPLGA